MYEKLSCSGILNKIYWILMECRCKGLALPGGKSKAELSRENGDLAVAAALLCEGHFARGERGRDISQPMAELWQQLRPEHSFSIEFSWHAASNAFSPRTARKNQSGFNIFQSEKKE